MHLPLGMADADHAKDIARVRDGVSAVFEGKPHLRHFCTDACCLRFLRARCMDVPKATKLLKSTLEWCEYFPPSFCAVVIMGSSPLCTQ